MTKEEAMKAIQEILEEATEEEDSVCYVTSCDAEALQMAIEALKAQEHTCPTCYWCSDYQESGTRCPIEEHYVLPKDGYCHLYEPYRKEQSDD